MLQFLLYTTISQQNTDELVKSWLNITHDLVANIHSLSEKLLKIQELVTVVVKIVKFSHGWLNVETILALVKIKSQAIF